MKLFSKPKYLKPEINEPKYWLHLLVISVVTFGILQLVLGGDMFNLKNILWGVPLLGSSDIIAHTILGLN